MSARAAWRLEAMGFEAYDYAGSKADWFACGMPREGKAAEQPWAGDLVRDDVPTCGPQDGLAGLPERVAASGYELCVVLNDERVVLGVLRGDALAKDPGSRVEDVMELGPRTVRPSEPVAELLRRRSAQGVKSWIVATSHGVCLGLLVRDDAEKAAAAVTQE
jgi:predicted transcriptional regulator